MTDKHHTGGEGDTMTTATRSETAKAPACRDCRFYSRVVKWGHCHAKPPLGPLHRDNRRWPEVYEEEWCGAFAGRDPAPPHKFETPCVFEHVARQRERAAWDACAEFGRTTVPRGGSVGVLHQRERDRLYPAPQQEEPNPGFPCGNISGSGRRCGMTFATQEKLIAHINDEHR